MKIEIQLSRRDFIEFISSYLKARLHKWIFTLIFLPVLGGYITSGTPFEIWKFVVGYLITFTILISINLIYPYLRFLRDIKKIELEKPSIYEKHNIILTEEHVKIEDVKKTTLINWDSIKQIDTVGNYLCMVFYDKTFLIIPKNAFASNFDFRNFIGFLKGHTKSTDELVIPITERKVPKFTYLFGIFCLIPFLGALFGIVLIILGIFKEKNKWMILIGLVGILVTTITIFYLKDKQPFDYSPSAVSEEYSQKNLNSLLKDIEFYKLIHGTYPNTLTELKNFDSSAIIVDILQSYIKTTKKDYYYILYNDNKYSLFSAGRDGIPGSTDDLFPTLQISDTNKIGLIIKTK